MKKLVSITRLSRTAIQIILILLFNSGLSAQSTDTIFIENFELGIGSWYGDNGLWDVGVATIGPSTAHSGQRLAGTVLNGKYTDNSNTRLISPVIYLDTLQPGKKLLLKFWYWHKNRDDSGRIQISVDGGAWTTISSVLIDDDSPVWTQYVADLSVYAGSSIRIAFYFLSNNQFNAEGWYVDDVSVVMDKYCLLNPEGFEVGVGNWSSDNGLWQIGKASVGPDSAYSGHNVAGTVLNGNYPVNANTRLISPEFTLQALEGESPTLFFRHWYEFASNDNGRVQISVNGGQWETVSSPLFDGNSPIWVQYAVDLSPYKDSTIQIAFYFTSSNQTTHNGWYIDSVRIEGVVSSSEEKGTMKNPGFLIFQNHPNPFSSSTTINYKLFKPAQVELAIYNTLGQKIKTLVNQFQPIGEYQTEWKTDNRFPTGVYWYILKVNDKIQAKKMVVAGY